MTKTTKAATAPKSAKKASKPRKAASAPRTTKTETASPTTRKAAENKVARLADFQALRSVPTTKAMEDIMTKSKDQMEKLSNEAVNAGKEGLDAWMKSSSILMKGYEDIMKTCMGLAQKSAEKNGEAFKTLLSCKSMNEFAELQNRLAQEGLDDLMTGAAKLSELGVKLASDGFAPINDQLGKAIKKAGDAMAA